MATAGVNGGGGACGSEWSWGLNTRQEWDWGLNAHKEWDWGLNTHQEWDWGLNTHQDQKVTSSMSVNRIRNRQ